MGQPNENILSGTDEIINRWFEFKNGKPLYEKVTGCRELSNRKNCGEVVRLIERLYNRIQENWVIPRNYKKQPSKKNWKLRCAPHRADDNESVEKQLEKEIATRFREDWFNQIPTASGLTSSVAMKKASIDLVHRVRLACYEIIELKWNVKTDTPLFAAIEILLYGLLYIHARIHQEEMSYCSDIQELLAAEEISLRVLAPKRYYDNYNLGWFERRLSDGIAQFVADKSQKSEWHGASLKVDFRFTAFPERFEWNKQYSDEKLQEALDGRVNAFSLE